MRILLDTHCWLWMQAAPDRLSAEARQVLSDADHLLQLSAVSSWEIAIKWTIGKLNLPEPPQRYIPTRMRRQGVTGLAVEHEHALRSANLPRIHRDPFDRLLVAQAQFENLTLMTADDKILQYPDVEVFSAG